MLPGAAGAQAGPAAPSNGASNVTGALLDFASNFPNFYSLAAANQWIGWYEDSEDPCAAERPPGIAWTNLECERGRLTGFNFTDVALGGESLHQEATC